MDQTCHLTGLVERSAIRAGRLAGEVSGAPAGIGDALILRHAVRALAANADQASAIALGDAGDASDLARHVAALRASSATRPDRDAPWAIAAARDAGLQGAAPAAALEAAQRALVERGREGSAVIAAARAAGAIAATAPASTDAERLAGLVGAIALARVRFLPEPWAAPARLDAAARSAAVQAGRSGAWDEWLLAWSTQLERELEATEIAVARAIRAMARQRTETRARRRVGATDGAVIERLQAQLTFTIRDASDELDLTPPTVGTSIERLTAAGHAVELTGRRRDRVWMAAPLRELIGP